MPKRQCRTPETKMRRGLLDEPTETYPTMEHTFLSPPRLFIMPLSSPRKMIFRAVDFKGQIKITKSIRKMQNGGRRNRLWLAKNQHIL